LTSHENGTDPRICLITTPTEDAVGIARAIVQQKLAACVNIVPLIRSIYRWKSDIEESQESLLVAKTTKAAMAALTEAVRALHPYETFELVSVAIDGGNLPYLEWIGQSVVTE
jgi:periplasmic divalent cation tolerance protein